MKSCAVAECDRVHFARGWCHTHYERWRAHGDPLVVLPRGLPKGARRGGANPAFVGDDAAYSTVHSRLVAERGLASEHDCGCGAPAADWAFDEPRGHSVDLDRYTPMCRRCHRRMDAA